MSDTTTYGEPVYMQLEDGTDSYWMFEDGTLILWGHITRTKSNKAHPPRRRKARELTAADYRSDKPKLVEKIW